MQSLDDIASRRLKIVVEQYVDVRKRRHDFVSTDQASRAIRQVVKASIEDRALDEMIAACAIEKELAVVFDRGERFDVARPR